MRSFVLLVSLIVVSWSALAAAQDPAAQREPAPTPAPDTDDTDAASPDEASESAPTEPEKVPEKPTPSDDIPADSPSVSSEDASEPDALSGAEMKSEQAAEHEQPTQPPPSITPQVVAPPSSPDIAVPGPDETQGRLEASVPRSVRTEERKWTASQPVLTLHGYMRMRGELEDSFWLGREAGAPEDPPEPFSRFIPLERRNKPQNCGGDCDVDSLQFANLRLRLAPQLNISDDVRVKMMFDMFDNMVAGSTPVSYYGTPRDTSGAREAFSSSDIPPEQSDFTFKGDVGDSIVVRRAWGEVRNRSLGELRFGRMPNHWGLGIMNNAGNELDDDFSSEIDKLMLITKLIGIYFTASYDFIFEGFLKPNDSSGLVSEVNQLDDVDQFSFTVSRRLDAEKQRSLLESGGVALNGGVYFSYREQDYYTIPPTDAQKEADPAVLAELNSLGAETFTWDAYGELRWEGLRLGYEASFTWGEINDLATDNQEDKLDILQFGTAFEFEYRLLDDKLGLHFDTGFASGDGSVEGLSAVDDYIEQQDNNNTISTFRFHPAYRIDLILWRTIMRQITGAYYFRPGINYDFIRNQFGQLFGARLNVLWSRAAVPKQTWGDDPDLGVEINLSLYWRSEDGPELMDGFHAMVQWGILFPMQGLGYTSDDKEDLTSFDELEIPNALRVVLGIVF